MPQFSQYKADGRELLVQFTCQRCKTTHIDPLEKHKDDDHEHYGHLKFGVKPPEGWAELLHGPLLCPGCVEAYKRFMNPIEEA